MPIAVLSIAQAYATLGNAAKLEAALERLTKVMPESPEAWYDLAVLKCGLGKVARVAGRAAPGTGFERQAAQG